MGKARRAAPTTDAPRPAPSPEGADRAPHDRQAQLGNARLVEVMKGKAGAGAVDDLVDLTPSQAHWIRQLRELELLNPQATVEDLSMALSLKVWSASQMWDENGKSQYPGLILDYQGGDGYRKVRFDDGQRGGRRVDEGALKEWSTDHNGRHTNVNHAFPAVASQAGRSWLSGEYASFMATSGGDTLQNLGETVVNGKIDQWNAGEYAGNQRAEDIADRHHSGGRKDRLSELMLGRFREENRPR